MPRPVNEAVTKPKNVTKTIKQFLASIKPWRNRIIVMIILAVVGVLLTVFGPMVLGQMTTSATDSIAKGEGINWGEISSLAVLLIVLYVASSIITYIQGVVMARVSAKYTKNLREQILAKINKLPMSYFDNVKIGDVMSRMTNDVDAVAGELANTVTEIISAIVTLVGILAMMLYISIPLSALAVVAIPVSMFFVAKISKKSQVYYRSQRKLVGSVNSNIEEDYTGQLLIKANSHDKKSNKDFSQTRENLYRSTWRSPFYGSLAYPISGFFTDIAYTMIAMFGGMYMKRIKPVEKAKDLRFDLSSIADDLH